MKYIFIITMFFSGLEASFFINKNNSEFGWIGRKLTGEHSGNIQISSIDLVPSVN